MKKIICIIAVVLMIASVVYAQKKAGITAKDLAGIKGTWEGMLAWGVMDAANSPAKLEILNDAVPLKAKLTVSNVPPAISSQLGLMSGSSAFESDEGVITSQGTLMWTGPAKNFIELSKSGEKKLKGWYYFKGVKGDMSLTKK